MATATFDTLHATKADIAELRADIASLETRLVERIDAVETRVAERFEALYKQLWLMALGIVTAVAAIVKLL